MRLALQTLLLRLALLLLLVLLPMLLAILVDALLPELAPRRHASESPRVVESPCVVESPRVSRVSACESPRVSRRVSACEFAEAVFAVVLPPLERLRLAPYGAELVSECGLEAVFVLVATLCHRCVLFNRRPQRRGLKR
ncbi:hypothetical protein M885DRAFT_258054 [Pelagophyceae sp. CCMP2097]|nr:hypothetical protein M885DRAFT_258054 [Pelagophyceae sp. CCMP2097]